MWTQTRSYRELVVLSERLLLWVEFGYGKLVVAWKGFLGEERKGRPLVWGRGEDQD